MKLDLTKHNAELTCPSCHRKFKESLARLVKDPTIVCPGCGKPIQINAAGFRAEAKKLEDALGQLDDAFKGLGKKR